MWEAWVGLWPCKELQALIQELPLSIDCQTDLFQVQDFLYRHEVLIQSRAEEIAQQSRASAFHAGALF